MVCRKHQVQGIRKNRLITIYHNQYYVCLIDSIDIYTHYLLFFPMSYFNPFQKTRNKATKAPITILSIVIQYNSSSTIFFIWDSSTTFKKVSAIYFKQYYYGWLHTTDFSYDLLLGFHPLIFLQHKNTKQHSIVIILHIRCER